MSERDRDLLDRAGLSAARVAQMLAKSRQAVSKGIGGEADYFSPSDLIDLNEAVAREMPDRHPPLRDAVGDLFQSLAERLGASPGAPRDMEDAIASARRLWLILPGFPVSYAEQPAVYDALFASIDARRPVPPGGDDELDVVVYCDRGRPQIEQLFDHAWFDERLLAVVQCDVVGKMFAPIVVADPHLASGRACYALAARGFERIAPRLASDRVVDFGDHVSEKIRQSRRVQGRQLDAMTASAGALIAAGVEDL